MSALAASGLAVAGAVVGVPIAAVAYSVPDQGRIRLRKAWWRGAPARPARAVTVSLLTGLTAGVVGWKLPVSPALPAFWVFGVLAVGLAITDLRCHRLPHVMTGALVASSVLCFAAAAVLDGRFDPLLRASVVGLITAVAMLVLALSLPGQLGLGDVALAGAISLNLGWLSWQAAAVGLVVAWVVQAIGVLVILSVQRCTRRKRVMPMGPALLAGWLVATLAVP